MITNCWLNINRDCNLRCKWCYAKYSQYSMKDVMDSELAKQIIDLVSQLDIPSITILGGEPTCYSEVFEIIKYAKQKRRRVGVVTNGIVLSDKLYLNDLEMLGVDSIGLSLKGYSRVDFIKETGVDKYDKAMEAISNLSCSNIPFSVSIVIYRDNTDKFIEGVKDAVLHGAKRIYLSFCHEFGVLYNADVKFDLYKDMISLIEGFCKHYDELNEITQGNFVLHQSLPYCIWPDNIINKLKEKHQINSSCQLLQRSGLIFDVKGHVLPCNAMMNTPLGKIGKDFSNKSQFIEYWKSDTINQIFTRLNAIPDKDCLECKWWSECGGGCISNWYNTDFYELKKYMSLEK